MARIGLVWFGWLWIGFEVIDGYEITDYGLWVYAYSTIVFGILADSGYELERYPCFGMDFI
jgi:hypothetical protein